MLEVMADDTFEQLSIPASTLGGSAAFLKEGSGVLLLFADDRVISGASAAGVLQQPRGNQCQLWCSSSAWRCDDG